MLKEFLLPDENRNLNEGIRDKGNGGYKGK
jgi:hypothetical protein